MTLHEEPASSGHRYSDVVQVFEPNALAFPSLGEYIEDLRSRRHFIVELAGAEVRGQRTSTLLGELWTLVDPIFQAAIYLFLFLIIRGPGGGSTEFVTTLIGSVFLFNYTKIALMEGGKAVVRSKGLVLNAIFPRALLPISEVYKGLLSTVPAMVLYALIHLVAQRPITGAILMLPLLLLIQTGLNLGLAFLLSTATAFFRDVGNLLAYLMRILMYTTPIIYPVAALGPGLRQVLAWNPLFALFASYQAILSGQTPSAGMVFQSIGWAALLLGSGIWVFLRHERSFGLHI